MWVKGLGVLCVVMVGDIIWFGPSQVNIPPLASSVVILLLWAKLVGYPDYLAEFNKQKAVEDEQKRREEEIHQAHLQRIREGKA